MSLQDNLIVAANFENSCCQLHRSVYQELKNLVEYLRAFIWCRVLVVILSCCSIYLSIYLSLQGKTRSRKTCWKGAGCHTLGDLSNVHAKHSSLRGACITLLLLFPLLQRYRHFHLQQDIFTPIVDCRCQVTAENRYKKTSLPAPRLAGEWYKYLIATVSLPWHRQNYFTPACCDHQCDQPLLAASVSISGCIVRKVVGQHLFLDKIPSNFTAGTGWKSQVWSGHHQRHRCTAPLLRRRQNLGARRQIN